MLTSVVVRLTLRFPASLPASHGELVRCEFLQQIGSIDSTIASELHGRKDSNFRSYTLSSLIGPMRTDMGRAALIGSEYELRICALDNVARRALAGIIARARVWRFGQAVFDTNRWLTTPAEHWLAGEYKTRPAASDSCERAAVQFRFLSPTILGRYSSLEDLKTRTQLPYFRT